jgi:hypothetical protein
MKCPDLNIGLGNATGALLSSVNCSMLCPEGGWGDQNLRMEAKALASPGYRMYSFTSFT